MAQRSGWMSLPALAATGLAHTVRQSGFEVTVSIGKRGNATFDLLTGTLIRAWPG